MTSVTAIDCHNGVHSDGGGNCGKKNINGDSGSRGASGNDAEP